MYGLQTTLEMAAAAARIAAASTMMAAAGTKLAPTLQRTQPRYQARDVLLMTSPGRAICCLAQPSQSGRFGTQFSSQDLSRGS